MALIDMSIEAQMALLMGRLALQCMKRIVTKAPATCLMLFQVACKPSIPVDGIICS